MKRKLLLALILSLLATGLSAQQLLFETLDFPSLYGNIKYTTACEDSSGLLWLGTDKGLFTYDGSTIDYVQLGQEKEPHITCLTLSKNGRLLVGSKTGLVWQQSQIGKTMFYPDKISNVTRGAEIRGLYAESYNEIWAATYGNGIFARRNQDFVNPTPLIKDCYSLCFVNKRELWAGTDEGIVRLDTEWPPQVKSIITTKDGLNDQLVFAISCLGNGEAAIGTHSGGLQIWSFSKQAFLPLHFENSDKNPIKGICRFKDNFWVNFQQEGLVRYSRQGNMLSKEQVGSISHLQLGEEDNLWVIGEEAVKRAKLSITRFPLAGEAAGRISAMVYYGKNEIWFAGEQGLFRLKEGKAVKVNSIQSQRIISLFKDKYGFVWAGTFDEGVYRINPETFEADRYNEASGLINNNVLNLTGTGDTLWFATLGGLSSCTISSREVEFFVSSIQKEIGAVYIYSLFADTLTGLWVGTDGKGLFKYDGSLHRYTDPFQGTAIYSMASAGNGRIHIATSNKGVWEMRDGEFHRLGEEKGEVTYLFRSGQVTTAAFFRDKTELFRDDGSVVSMPRGSGLFFRQPDINAVCSRGERLWLPYETGILQIDFPQGRNRLKPRLLLKNVLLFLKPLEEIPNSFKYRENYIAFDYKGIWMQEPDAVTYRVKLSGLDSQWRETRDTRYIFNNLRPGNYVFEIEASLYGNFVNASAVRIPFRVAPPFWYNPLLWILTLMILAGLFMWYIRARDRRKNLLEKLEREKVTFKLETLRSQVNPHFLFNCFNTLQTFIETSPANASLYVEKLSDFFRHLLLLKDKNAISLEEELNMLKNYEYLQRQRFGNRFSIQLDIPPEYLSFPVPPMVLQLLVENALNHNILNNSETFVIYIYVLPEKQVLVVSNPLRKKEDVSAGTGMGLANIAARIRIVNGREMELNQTEENFEVIIPLGK